MKVRTIRPGGDQQHRGQRDLRDDQRVARAMPLAAFARAARAVLQRRRHVRPRVLQDRNRAEQQAGDERDAEREQQDDRIERDLVEARQLRRLQVEQQSGCRHRPARCRARRRAARSAATRTSAARRPGGLRRRARDESPAPAVAPRRAPGTGSRRWRTRPAARGRRCRAESTACCRCRRPRRRRAAAPAIRTAHRRTSACVKPGGSLNRSVSDGSSRSTSALACSMRHAGLEPRDALVVEARGVGRGAIDLLRQHDRPAVCARNWKSSGSTPITSRARAVDHQALADGRRIAAEGALPVGDA